MPPRSTHVRAVLAALLLAPAIASADLRLFEQGEPGTPSHRFLDMTGYLQPGFVYRQDDPQSQATDDMFWLQRARFGFRGQLAPFLYFQFEGEMFPTFVLNDAFIELRPHDAFRVRAGQFQLAFLRTFQFGESNIAFIDRSVFTPQSPDRPVLRYLSPRDIGLMLTGRIGDTSAGATSPVLEYWAGAFNGRGANVTRNDDGAFLMSGRVQLHVLGVPDGVEAESDLARNTTPRPSVAAGVYSNCDDRRQWNRGFTVDAELRYQGLFASAAFVRFLNGPAGGLGDALGYEKACGELPGETALTHVALGASAQAQYVLPKTWFPFGDQALEVLARWDYVAPQNPDDGSFLGGDETSPGYAPPPNFRSEDNPPTRWRITAGVNWFPTGSQRLRLSFNYQLNREAEIVRLADGPYEAIANDVAWLQLTASL